MSDRIAVMHARPHRAAGHAGGPLRPTGDVASWPTSSAPPTCSTVPLTALENGGRHRATRLGRRCCIGGQGRAIGQEVDLSLRPEAISIRDGTTTGTSADARCRLPSSSRVLGHRRSSTRSARREGRAHGPGTQERRATDRRSGGRALTGCRATRSCWAIDRQAWRRLDDEDGWASPGPGGDGMKHPYDGSSIDLERELVRYMAERKVTRRELLERIGRRRSHGGSGPRHRRMHGQRRERQPIAESGRRPTDGALSGGRRPTAAPTPVPSPESELFIYNYAEYMDPEIIKQFEDKYGVKVTETYFDSYDVMFPRVQARRHGLRPDLPDRHRHPGPRRGGPRRAARPLAHPERRQPGGRMGGSRLRPGPQALDALHVVDDRLRLRHEEDRRGPDELGGALGPASTTTTS